MGQIMRTAELFVCRDVGARNELCLTDLLPRTILRNLADELGRIKENLEVDLFGKIVGLNGRLHLRIARAGMLKWIVLVRPSRRNEWIPVNNLQLFLGRRGDR